MRIEGAGESPPRRPARRYQVGDSTIDAQVDALVARYPDHPHADLAREMIVTALKLLNSGADRGDMRQYNTALKEMRYATRVFAPWRHVRKATIFGSARIRPEDPSYQQAVEFSRRISAADWMVITGAGPGIMQAGNEGAGKDRSFGVNIRLPFEQGANAAIRENPKLISFKYFFTRKLFFVKESHAIVLFPGGFGTLDEGAETLTLIQTGKSSPIPIVLVDNPGGDYWSAMDAFFRGELLTRGLISPEDVKLYRVTDSVEAAVEEVLGFYRNYHSMRLVRGRTLIRMHRPPPEAEKREFLRDFRWLLTGGTGDFEFREGPVEEEGPGASKEPLWRILFPFDRRSYGRLRLLIDRINLW
jgi:uncharacterized protein (TIGR00730 family)